MAGIVPSGPQYGDKTALRQAGVKFSPETETPTFFNPSGGRPRKTAANPMGLPQVPSAQASAPDDPLIPQEHQDLFDRATNLAAAARGWDEVARSPQATPQIKRIAAAVRKAAEIAVLQGRHGTPYVNGEL